MRRWILPLALVGEWLLLAIVVAFEIAETLVVRRVPRTKPVLPLISTPFPLLKAIVLPAPAVAPPIVLLLPRVMTIPATEFGRGSVPSGSVPM